MPNINKAKVELILEKQINDLEEMGIPASSKLKFNELKINLVELKKYAWTNDVVIWALQQACIDGINEIVDDIKSEFQKKLSKLWNNQAGKPWTYKSSSSVGDSSSSWSSRSSG